MRPICVFHQHLLSREWPMQTCFFRQQCNHLCAPTSCNEESQHRYHKAAENSSKADFAHRTPEPSWGFSLSSFGGEGRGEEAVFAVHGEDCRTPKASPVRDIQIARQRFG